MTLQYPHLLNLIDYSVVKQQELCSSFYIIKYFFEYPRSDFRKEIAEKRKFQTQFSSAELTYLMYQQLGTLQYLNSKDMSHGDIQPLFLGWDAANMNSKLIDRLEEPWVTAKTKQVQKNRLLSNQPIYQSPIMYSNLKKGNLNFEFDPYKEDVFALGLTILEAGVGQPIQNIYDQKQRIID